MAEVIRDPEHHIGGRVHVTRVRSPDPYSAAPVTDSRGEWETAIYTRAGDDLSEFDNDDPQFLAQRVVVEISTRRPDVPEAELAAFYDEVVAWICEHRGVAAEKAHESDVDE
jgi:hypothetical protein